MYEVVQKCLTGLKKHLFAQLFTFLSLRSWAMKFKKSFDLSKNLFFSSPADILEKLLYKIPLRVARGGEQKNLSLMIKRQRYIVKDINKKDNLIDICIKV